MKILLLIDIQNDFCPGGALAVEEGNQVVQVANKLMQSGQYDLVIATKDWHPADHKSFAANHPEHKLGEVIDLHGMTQRLWPTHCVQNTPGSEFHPDLDTTSIHHVVFKGENKEIDSYSGFFDNGHRNQTRLADIIREEAQSRGVPESAIEIDCMGLALDYCVKFTALDAAKSLGFKTNVILDGCRSVNIQPNDHLEALRELRDAGVEIVESRSIMQERSIVRAREQTYNINL